MPLYAILKKYFGEYLDLFVIILIGMLWYYGMLKLAVLRACLETLLFFYFYKIYYLTFVRQWDNSKIYSFSWDLNRIFTDKFLKKNKWFIYVVYIICVLFPFNLFWYVLITITVKNKLIKVWFNGNKDIFFFKYFNYDIRHAYEKYIIWYYDNIDKYVKIFVHQPFNRIIVIPTIIRTSLIHSSFFSILKARMFMFVFISMLVFTGLNEYLHQPIYVWIIIIYVYFLLVWPWIIKLFNIEYVNMNDSLTAYGTPQTIFSAFILASVYSVSLQSLKYFFYYSLNPEIDNHLGLYYYFIFPNWYRYLLIVDMMNNQGLIDYANIDRKVSAIVFWRYEKTYTSFISLRIFSDTSYHKPLLYKFAINQGFYGRHISEREIEEIKEFLELYIKISLTLLADTLSFFNPHPRDDQQVLKCFFDYNTLENTSEVFLFADFFNSNDMVINREEITLEFISTKRYKNMLRNVVFFFYMENCIEITRKFKMWLSPYIDVDKKDLKILGKNLAIKSTYREDYFSDRWWNLLKLILEKYMNRVLFPDDVEAINSIFEEYNKLEKQDVIKMEDIKKLLKYKSSKK